MEAKEIYEREGIIKGSKDIFMIMEDGSLSLKTYIGDNVIEWENPELVPCGKGNRIHHGKENGSGLRSSMSFRNYDDGEIDKRWKKIM